MPGGSGDDRLAAFTTFLLLSEAMQAVFWAWLTKPGALPPSGPWPSAITLAAIAASMLGLRRAWLRHAACAAMLVTLVRIVVYFPAAPNHTYLELWCFGILALCGFEAHEERGLALNALGWLTLIVLFASGLQKVAHGLYFRGQFLAFQHHVAHRIGWFDAIFSRQAKPIFEGVGPLHLGAGPFRLNSAGGMAVANLVWMVEVLVPLGLFFVGPRRWILAGGLGVFVVIVGSAKELVFGMLFVQLLCLFSRRDLNTPLLPICAALFGLMTTTLPR
jgi:hypothetical protein